MALLINDLCVNCDVSTAWRCLVPPPCPCAAALPTPGAAPYSVDAKVDALNAGADDYITKPFNILEVKARIKAIMRRAHSESQNSGKTRIIEKSEMKLDLEGRRAYISGKEINLTAKEFDVLELLALHPDKVYSREELLGIVWGKDYPGDERTVDVHIRRLREKIETSPSDPKYVHTKWGVGYYFEG